MKLLRESRGEHPLMLALLMILLINHRRLHDKSQNKLGLT